MFQQFFGMDAMPFSKSIATDDVLATSSLKELVARLTMAVRERGKVAL